MSPESELEFLHHKRPLTPPPSTNGTLTSLESRSSFASKSSRARSLDRRVHWPADNSLAETCWMPPSPAPSRKSIASVDDGSEMWDTEEEYSDAPHATAAPPPSSQAKLEDLSRIRGKGQSWHPGQPITASSLVTADWGRQTSDCIEVTELDGSKCTRTLSWKDERDVGISELMSDLGSADKAVQRGWSYKLNKTDPRRMLLRFGPSDVVTKAARMRGVGRLEFTIIFNTFHLFEFARKTLPKTLPSLHPSTFFRNVVDPIRPSQRFYLELATLETSHQYRVGPTITSPLVTDAHVALVVRCAREVVTQQCRLSMDHWFNEARIPPKWSKTGSWASLFVGEVGVDMARYVSVG
ncbi:hypothetical protein M427DRAFT_27556 [Gonapodya prolifera JEL478]|uniref:Uncharacterized protein n=1 Tax=Gonapodya prolifera (strain JEL478) TaxID=1344416 RepID=A0A139AWJ1_GONPJ|nr:hypothetical protein M427DRAFT_27556 [Gonapodya prolifera JEL478]|eukprot:KXS21106.1 hypothetical protein M427DRAFT_27556 [Gonapodya prolifera JEL478]